MGTAVLIFWVALIGFFMECLVFAGYAIFKFFDASSQRSGYLIVIVLWIMVIDTFLVICIFPFYKYFRAVKGM